MDHGKVNHQSFRYYRRLARVKRFVEENLDDSITLARAARVAGLERTYFSAFFRSKTGVGFREWLNELRVARAQELMTEVNYSITEVAFTVGFQDLRTFERAFKRTTGRTPREYKKSVRPA